MSDIFSVLADPTRRALLQALAVSSRTVGDLVNLTGEGQPTVSKHLKTLRDAGLVTVEAVGQARLYSINLGPLADVATFISGISPAEAVAPAGSSPSAAPSTEVERVLTGAAVALSGWLTDGASWLGSKVQDKVSEADIDTVRLGKELGRRLADAKLQATDAASDAQVALSTELAELSNRLGVSAAELRSATEELLSETRRAAGDRLASAKDAVLNRGKLARQNEPESLLLED